MSFRWPLLILCLLAACARDFGRPPPPTPDAGPPPVALQPLGTSCADAGACASGSCVDGLCCEQACPASQACNDPRAPGRCTDHPLGTPCDGGAACPSGACVDGVCCEAACGACQRCDLPGLAGRCAAAPEGSDLHHDCGPCQACSAGACAPAAPGSDPHAECGAGRCSPAGTCGAVDGGPCASDADCAVGRCLAGACVQAELELLDGPELNHAATDRNLLAVAANPFGDVAVAFEETAPDPAGGLAEDDLFFAVRLAGQAGWRAQDLGPRRGVPMLAALVFLGRTPWLLTYNAPPALSGACPAAGPADCGLTATPMLADGQLGPAVRLGQPDGQAFWGGVSRLAAYPEPGGAVASSLGYAGGAQAALHRRGPEGAWADAGVVDPLPIADSSTVVELARSGGAPHWLLANDDTVALLDPAGRTEARAYSADGGSPCTWLQNLQADLTPRPGGEVDFTLRCVEGNGYRTYLGRYAPQAQPAFRFEALPADVYRGQFVGDFLVWGRTVTPSGASEQDLVQVAWAADGGWASSTALTARSWQQVFNIQAVPGAEGLPFMVINTGTVGFDADGNPIVAAPNLVAVRYHR